MLTSVTLVSPHQDDAAFSLAECVRRLVARGVGVRVVNCFTRSEHAPYRAAGDARAVSAIRAAEDRAALTALGVTDVVDLGLLDAPLRLGVALHEVCEARLRDSAAEREAASLGESLGVALAHGNAAGSASGTSVVLAPLAAPGAHVDHWIAHRAAVLATPIGRLAFYEELPYATRVAATETAHAARALARALGTRLDPITLTTPDDGATKRRLALHYASQIAVEELTTLDGEARRGFAERLWAPPGGVDLAGRLTH